MNSIGRAHAMRPYPMESINIEETPEIIRGFFCVDRGVLLFAERQNLA
jgi:hypothetical protein